MPYTNLPQYPYGAVYFRKSNPPAEDWERDYKKAAEEGMNSFRHWVMWHAIEIKPGKFVWDEYDAQLDLAAKYGIKTIIGECLHSAPEWAFRRYAHARFEDAQGMKVHSNMRNSSVTGGFPGLCLDNKDYQEIAGYFLSELVKRYKDHPGLGGYDVWNETNLVSSGCAKCHCKASLENFRQWLGNKYGDLETLAEAWKRYSFEDWEDVQIPRRLAFYPECIDYIDFNVENAGRLFKWRVDTIKSIDPVHVITAHGVNDGSLHRRVYGADDAFLYARELDCYGYSGGGGVTNDSATGRWNKLVGADCTRAGSNGKPFWAAERTSGPKWQFDRKTVKVQSEHENWSPDKGNKAAAASKEIPTGEDIRVDDMIAMAAGAKGLFSNRWRGLLDGPYFGMMGYYGMDGQSTDRSELASRVAKWANDPAQAELWKSNPVRGDIGIINVPESQVCIHLLMDSSESYRNALRGLYTAFMDVTLQPDFVWPEQMDRYELLYLPCPIMMKQQTIKRIIEWVKNGGILVSDGCPGYFHENGRAGAQQLHSGLDKLFGCVEEYVEFTNYSLSQERPTFSLLGTEGFVGGSYLQAYRLLDGKAAGYYSDGRVAAVENTYGKGRTLLIGTVPGLAYSEKEYQEGKELGTLLLKWAGREQHVKCSSDKLVVRMHEGDGGTYLWAVNQQKHAVSATIQLSEKWVSSAIDRVLRGDTGVGKENNLITVTVPQRDAVVIHLGK